MKNVLVLGAGLVARPLVHFLMEKGYRVTCADLVRSKAETIIDGHPSGEAVELDLLDEQGLARFIGRSDLTVSLVPFTFHPAVAKLCVSACKPMVTTSYVSEAMQDLDGPAKDAGIVILNEIGLDPGIDHMSAMQIIDGVRARGGEVISFKSYCGGLPAVRHNDNPFGYKFSWAPRGVLLASRNGAKYLWGGREVKTAPERLFRDMHLFHVEGVGDFEAYPNRDSVSYVDIYGLSGIQTLFRATLRNIGWCDTMFNFRNIGLLALEETDVKGKTYADFMRKLVEARPGEDLRVATARKMGVPPDALPVWNLHWLGAFSDRKFPCEKISPLDALGALMFEKLSFRKDEVDLIVLCHDFIVRYPDGKRERITSQLVDEGIPGGDSAMSRTVSLPAAIASDLILTGKITEKGVLRPVQPVIYEPVLRELARRKIACREKVETF
jgi:saccharopine dehydrogenase-like NADP-dependent oxidoreductase